MNKEIDKQGGTSFLKSRVASQEAGGKSGAGVRLGRELSPAG
jgi:hypothetical protein